MCEIVDIKAYSRKRARRPAQRLTSAATTFVLVPNDRLSRLREFWSQLKAEVEAEADDTPQHLLRR